MGIFDVFKNEFIDIIDWVDDTSDTLIWKFPRHDNEIKMNQYNLNYRNFKRLGFITLAELFCQSNKYVARQI